MILQQSISVLAPMVGTIQSVPQLLHTLREDKFDGLSIHSLFLMILVNVLWFLHGYYIWDYSLMISSSLIFIINITIVAIFMWKRKSIIT